MFTNEAKPIRFTLCAVILAFIITRVTQRNITKSTMQLNFSSGGYGPEKVRQISGYFDVDQGHIFFWLFESRDNPRTDPLVVWLQGGPGWYLQTYYHE